MFDDDPFESASPAPTPPPNPWKFTDADGNLTEHTKDVLADEAKRVLSDDFKRRLQRAEHEVESMTQAEREAIADWLGAMLHRPPLEKPNRAWRPARALVEALWWDIADRTPADPADPDAGNPRLDANHPWGEGDEA